MNEVDLQQSRVYVKTLHTGLGHSHGIEGKLASGVLRLSAAQGAGTLVFDMKSFQADTAEARKRVELKPKDDASTAAKVTAEMLGAAVLDTATHPTATFDVDSAQLLDRDKKTGELKYLISGMLTLRGVKRSVKIQVKGEPRGDFVRLTGNFPLLQSDFRIKPFSTMLGAMGVANQLTIYGDLLVRSPTPPVPPPAPAAAKAPAGRGKPPRKG